MSYRAAILALGVGVCLGGGMSPARAAEAGQEASSAQRYDEQGNVVRVGPIRPSSTLFTNATACLELHVAPTTTWKIQLIVNPTTYPFTIVGGTITGSICNSPNWSVTGGSMGSSVTINANYTGTSSCASSTTIIGNFVSPDAYVGTYGYDGASTTTSHQLLFKGWGPC